MNDLVGHLEAHLGPIQSGWTKNANGLKPPFQVAKFEGGPIAGATTLVTVGLSDTRLPIGSDAPPETLPITGAKKARLELLMMARDEARFLPGVLQQVANRALESNRGYMRGEVIGPGGPLTDDATVEALYVAAPVYFPEDFHVVNPDSGDDAIVLVWLVPITGREAAYVRREGWDAFEAELEKEDPICSISGVHRSYERSRVHVVDTKALWGRVEGGRKVGIGGRTDLWATEHEEKSARSPWSEVGADAASVRSASSRSTR